MTADAEGSSTQIDLSLLLQVVIEPLQLTARLARWVPSTERLPTATRNLNGPWNGEPSLAWPSVNLGATVKYWPPAVV